MNRDELRAAQEPLKARYREDPDAAVHAVSASAVFAEPVTVEVSTTAGAVRAGLHPATGGDGSDACSGDMLMEALVACAGVTLHAVSVAFGVDLGEVAASGGRRRSTRAARSASTGRAPVGVLGPRSSPRSRRTPTTPPCNGSPPPRSATASSGQSLRQPPTIEVRRRAPRDR